MVLMESSLSDAATVLTRHPLVLLEPVDHEHTESTLGQVMEWVDTVESALRRMDPDVVADALHARYPRLSRATIHDVVTIDRSARLDVVTNLRRALDRELDLTLGRHGSRAGT